MNLKRIFPAMIVLALAALACQTLLPQADPTTPAPLPTQPQPVQQPQGNQPPRTEDQVPRIPVSEAKAALDSGQAILVDVRSAESYAAGRAAGSINIPLANFENNIGSLSLEKSQWIITVCT
jgi:3-mercaptopyruvate sulfurtransferase SseA